MSESEDPSGFISVPTLIWLDIQAWIMENNPEQREEFWVSDDLIFYGNRVDDEFVKFSKLKMKYGLWDQTPTFN